MLGAFDSPIPTPFGKVAPSLPPPPHLPSLPHPGRPPSPELPSKGKGARGGKSCPEAINTPSERQLKIRDTRKAAFIMGQVAVLSLEEDLDARSTGGANRFFLETSPPPHKVMLNTGTTPQTGAIDNVGKGTGSRGREEEEKSTGLLCGAMPRDWLTCDL